MPTFSSLMEKKKPSVRETSSAIMKVLEEALKQMAQQEIQEALSEQGQRLRNEFRQQQQETLQNVETSLSEPEGKPKKPESSSSGGGEQTKRLEERVEKLELSVKRALEKVFPRVEALVSRLEEPSRESIFPPFTSMSFNPLLFPCSSSKATAPNPLSRPAKYLAQWELNKKFDAAVEEGRVDDVRRLLGAGADFQKIRMDFNFTPLMEATFKGHSDILLMLLEKGANVNTTNERGHTALHIAASNDLSGRCVVLLIGAEADVNCKRSDGCTPLHFAAKYGNKIAVTALLEAGANKKILNNSRAAPFNFATSDAIRRILQY